MTYIIAEIGGNHDGNLERALALIESAARSGVNAVKFQTYQAEKLVHPDLQALPQAKGYTKQINRFSDLELTQTEWGILQEHALNQGIDFLTSCFDEDSLSQWAPQMKAIKIASGDLTYHKLIRQAVLYGKPVLLSTGMASYEEIQQAANLVPRETLTVLHCVSKYPCSAEDANLGVIRELQKHYSSVGYSDHTCGITACLVAAGMGVTVLEKHFTDDNNREDGDHPLSANEEDMTALVRLVRQIETMIGLQKPAEGERDQRKKFRRGAYAARDLSAGGTISESDIIALRPSNGRKPHEWVGKRLRHNYKKLDPIYG